MAIQTINNLETAASVRGKINENFGEALALDPSVGLQVGGAAPSTEQAAQVLRGIAPASGHAQRLLNKMRVGAQDATLLIVGDSTGNASDEWVYLFSQWLGGQFPGYTVLYRVWGTIDYNAATTLQTGTGPRTLTVYNNSVAGMKPDYTLGELWPAAVQNLPAVDLTIVSHGHNVFSGETQDAMAMHWLELTEPLLMAHPDTGVILIAQNPERDTVDNDTQALAVRDVCAWRGFGLADAWSKFTALGKAAGLYADNVHPSFGLGSPESPTGTRLIVETVKEHFIGAPCAPATSVSLLAQAYGPNLLLNGSFADYPTSPGAPTGWTATNSTVTKDTVVKFGTNAYSVKVVGTGAGQPYLQQDLAANVRDTVLGRQLILAVAVFTPTTEDVNGGRVALLSTSNGSNTYVSTSTGKGGWWWKFLPAKIAAGDTFVRVRLFASTVTGAATPPSTLTAHFGAAILRAGKVPTTASA
jgi:hypothetical protein